MNNAERLTLEEIKQACEKLLAIFKSLEDENFDADRILDTLF